MTLDRLPGDDPGAELTLDPHILPGVASQVFLSLSALDLHPVYELDVRHEVPLPAHHLPTAGTAAVQTAS